MVAVPRGPELQQGGLNPKLCAGISAADVRTVGVLGTSFNPDQGSVVDLGRITPNLEVRPLLQHGDRRTPVTARCSVHASTHDEAYGPRKIISCVLGLWKGTLGMPCASD